LRIDRFKYWFLLASKFLAGQGIIQIINVATGLLLLRLLPVGEFALFSMAGALLALASLGTNLGLTSAFITIGAQVKDSPVLLGNLFATTKRYRGLLFLIVTCLMLILTPFLVHGRGWGLSAIGLTFLIVVMSNWVQLTLSLRMCIMNIHHDANSLWLSGLISAIARLVLTLLICRLLPLAVVALTINLVGFVISEMLLIRRVTIYASPAAPDQEMGETLKRFTYPLIPGVIYYALRGQISLILLGFFGQTSSIANLGALGRLGQILGLIGLLNVFLIQPYFARIPSKAAFIKKGSFVVGGYLLLALLLLGSAFVIPEFWLLVLGPNYVELKALMPLAFAVPLVALLGDILYILLMSRGWTKGQNWTVYIGVGVQALFIALVRIDTTREALLFSLLILTAHAAVQLILLLKSVMRNKLDWLGDLQIQNG
jgi:O-antigen/teichoic acid export membrane protein